MRLTGRRTGEAYPRATRAPRTQLLPFNFGSLVPGTNSFLIPVPGAQVGDGVAVNPDVSLSGAVFIAHSNVETDGVVHLELYNSTGAPIAVDEVTFTYTLFSHT